MGSLLFGLERGGNPDLPLTGPSIERSDGSMTAESIDHGRRGFLRGRGLAALSGLPLPWTETESFAAGCTACGACREACPEGIVKRGESGLPQLDFKAAGCSFCGACAEACPEALFDRARQPALPLTVVIGADCLAQHQVVCQSCGDACPERAIAFALPWDAWPAQACARKPAAPAAFASRPVRSMRSPWSAWRPATHGPPARRRTRHARDRPVQRRRRVSHRQPPGAQPP